MSQAATQVVIEDLARSSTRDDAARVYSGAIVCFGPEGIDWPKINDIIAGRWCIHGLSYIKTRAYMLLENKK